MEITKSKQPGDWLEVRITGRLDSYWADHFKTAMDELVREGTHKIRLDLAGVAYLSSAGIGVLIRCHKQFEAIRGKLIVANCSEAVREILRVARLSTLLATEDPVASAGMATTVAIGRRVSRLGVRFETFGQSRPEGDINCRPIGNADRFLGCRVGPDDCRTVAFAADVIGIGLGALGNSFDDCQGRFGEFLVAAGAAAYLPTDGTNVPDYLVVTDEKGPELQVCYGVLCAGALPWFARFEAEDETVGRVSLSNLVEGCLDLAKSDRIGLVMLGESAGLIGAGLRRSPTGAGEAGAPFAFPGVRDWLSFTAERAYKHSTVLVVGVAERGPSSSLTPLLRPMDPVAELRGHCHAAAFSYRPLPRGELDLRPAVTALFEQQTLQGILHLLSDQRPGGMGQSEFIRGACWFAPIREVLEEGRS